MKKPNVIDLGSVVACSNGLRKAGYEIPSGYRAVVVYSTRKPRSGDWWEVRAVKCPNCAYDCFGYRFSDSKNFEVVNRCLDAPALSYEMEELVLAGERFYGWIELEKL